MSEQPDPDLFRTDALADAVTTPADKPAHADSREGLAPDNFDYFGPRSDCVAIRSQDAVAVYLNAWDEVCIRREKQWDDEDDVVIRIRPEYLPALIAALSRYLP